MLKQLIPRSLDINATPWVPPNVFMVEHSIEIEVQHNLAFPSNFLEANLLSRQLPCLLSI